MSQYMSTEGESLYFPKCAGLCYFSHEDYLELKIALTYIHGPQRLNHAVAVTFFSNSSLKLTFFPHKYLNTI